MIDEAKALVGGVHDYMKRDAFGYGSNNWIVDAKHSASGLSMVANDPHLPLTYPSVFYLVHMTAQDTGLNVEGGTFPGLPAVLTGRGAHVGWGVTVVGYDVTDLYLETVSSSGMVSYKGTQEPLKATSMENFKIRNQDGSFGTQTLNVQVTRHGPILPTTRANGMAVSVHWTGQEMSNDVPAFIGLNNAASVDDGVSKLRNYATGAQNFVMADDQGNIAYDPHANVPDRTAWASKALPPWAPLPGDCSNGTGGYLTKCPEWGDGGANEYLPDSKLPFSKNPAQGFLATANADPVGTTDDNDPTNNNSVAGPAYPYLSFDYSDGTEYRHARINERLGALTSQGGKVSEDDMTSIQGDHMSRVASDLLPSLLPMLQGNTALAQYVTLLQNWGMPSSGGHVQYDCPSGLTGASMTSAPAAADVVADSAACYLFHAAARRLLPAVYADDFKGTGIYSTERTLKSFLYIIKNPTTADQSFCDDVTTPQTETCSDIVNKVFAAAVMGVSSITQSSDPSKWYWGVAHTLTLTNLAAPILTTGFQSDTYARPGGGVTVDVGTPGDYTGDPNSHDDDYSYGQGASVRRVNLMDSTTPTRVSLPGIERDGFFPTSNQQLVNDYMINQYHDWALSSSDVASQAVSTQVFNPG